MKKKKIFNIEFNRNYFLGIIGILLIMSGSIYLIVNHKVNKIEESPLITIKKGDLINLSNYGSIDKIKSLDFSDEDLIQVDSNYNLIPLKDGTTELIVNYDDGTKKSFVLECVLNEQNNKIKKSNEMASYTIKNYEIDDETFISYDYNNDGQIKMNDVLMMLNDGEKSLNKPILKIEKIKDEMETDGYYKYVVSINSELVDTDEDIAGYTLYQKQGDDYVEYKTVQGADSKITLKLNPNMKYIFVAKAYKINRFSEKSYGNYSNKVTIDIDDSTVNSVTNFRIDTSQYVTVDYIYATEGAYIDTGFVPKETTKATIDYQLIEGADNYGTLQKSPKIALGIFGSYSSGANRFQIYSTTPNQLTYGLGDSKNYVDIDFNRHKITFDIPNKTITDSNGTLYGNASKYDVKSNSIYIFRSNNQSSTSKVTYLNGTTKIYSLLIYDNNKLVMNLVPVYNKNTKTYGMYDDISNKFFGNASNVGSLLNDNQIIDEPTINDPKPTEQKPTEQIINDQGSENVKQEYVDTEYVQSNNSKTYLDTGIYANKNMRAEVTYQVIKFGDTHTSVFGAFSSSSDTKPKTYSRFQIFALKKGLGDSLANKIYKLKETNDDFDKHTAIIDAKNRSITLDGKVRLDSKKIHEYSADSEELKRTIFIGSMNHYTKKYLSEKDGGEKRIYSVKIFDNDKLIREYQPKYNVITDQCGLYDKVNNAFYPATQGTFSCPKEANNGQVDSNQEVISDSSDNNSLDENNTTNKKVQDVYINVPSGVSVVLKSGLMGKGAEIKPISKQDDESTVEYYFQLAPGNYQYKSSGKGYYTLLKSIRVSLSVDATTINGNPGLKKGTSKDFDTSNWESANKVYSYSDELNSMLDVSPEMEEKYKNVFTTPSFSKSKIVNEFSNAEDLRLFLKNLNNSNDSLYLFSVGNTERGLDIPLVIFTKTDISDCEKNQDLNCAASKIKNNSKTNVGYTAQIHGNEPAAGEGSLAVIKALDGSLGKTLLNNLNIYVIPRYNGDGSKKDTRANDNGVDMNRDQLFVSAKEVREVHNIYNLFTPEVTIDAHEQGVNNESRVTEEKMVYNDVYIGIGKTNNNPQQLSDLTVNIYKETLSNISNAGIYPTVYTGAAGKASCNSTNNAISRPYYALYGSLSLLVETNGIPGGRQLWKKRVLSHYITVEQYLKVVSNNSSTIKKIVTDSRNIIANNGVNYNEDDLLTLRHDNSWDINNPSNAKDGIHHKVVMYDANLNRTEIEAITGWKDISGRTRTRPTAYIISKDDKNALIAKEKLEANNITCYEAKKGTKYVVKQYNGTVNKDSRNVKNVSMKEMTKTFTNGAIVCPMNQIGGNVLAMTMEPDVTDSNSYNGSFVQANLLTITNIYRSEQSLVKDGNNYKVPVA